MLGQIVFSVGGSCREFLGNCFSIQFAFREDVLQVQGDVIRRAAEQLSHRLLRQPECLVLEYDADKLFSVFIAVQENFTVLHHFMFHLRFPPFLWRQA